MSTMLQQAIVDAAALKEAAMKNAEAAVIEKYSHEVRTAVAQILEQDEIDPLAGFGAETDTAGLGMEEEEVSSTTMEQVPMAHMPEVDEETFVEVDLDNIIAAIKDEDPSMEDALEAEVDIDDAMPEPEADAPANRDDDEIDINEAELVDLFKEMMIIDIPEIELRRANEAANHKDEVEADETLPSTIEKEETIYSDGMDSEDLEEYERTMAKNESLKRDNRELRSILETAKNRLQEISLQNARLLYANRVLTDSSLNEQQKSKIVELVEAARSVDEAKMVYETLQKTMASPDKAPRPQSLSEVVTKRSSVVLTGNRRDNSDTQTTDSSPTYNRWAKLAGMTKD